MTLSPLAAALLERALLGACAGLGPRAAVVVCDEPLPPRIVSRVAPEMSMTCGAAPAPGRSARATLGALPVAGQAVTGVLVHRPSSVADAARVAREIERALQPDGRAVVTLVGTREGFLHWRDAFRAAAFPTVRALPAAPADAASRLPAALIAGWMRFRASGQVRGLLAGLIVADLAPEGSAVPGSGEMLRSIFLPRFPRR